MHIINCGPTTTTEPGGPSAMPEVVVVPILAPVFGSVTTVTTVPLVAAAVARLDEEFNADMLALTTSVATEIDAAAVSV